MKETQDFVKYLYYDQNNKELSDEKKINNYANLLANIFYDVKEFDYIAANSKVSDLFDEKFETLKDVFTNPNDERKGISMMFPGGVMTKACFSIVLFDEKFFVKTIDFKNVIDDLSKPKYQKRYVQEMYKMFGEPYKDHYKQIINSQIQELERDSEYIK